VIDLEEFARYKKELEHARRERDKAIGALDQLRVRLQQEFGIDDESAIDTLLQQWQQEKAELEVEAERLLQELQAEGDSHE